MEQFRVCARFEAAKLRPRLLPWIVLLAVLGTTVAVSSMSRSADPPRRGFWLFAEILETTLPLASFFLVVMGCLSINDEVASGSLRSVLLRPVGRVPLLAAKVTVLVAFALLVHAFAIGAAWVAVRIDGGFGPVVLEIEGLEPLVKFDEPAMWGYAARLLATTALAAACAPLLGILISVTIDSAGAAVATGLLTYGMLKAAANANSSIESWSIPAYLDRPLAMLAELSQGIETHAAEVAELGITSPHCVMPLALGTVLAILATTVFAMRDVKC